MEIVAAAAAVNCRVVILFMGPTKVCRDEEHTISTEVQSQLEHCPHKRFRTRALRCEGSVCLFQYVVVGLGDVFIAASDVRLDLKAWRGMRIH